MRRAAPPLGAHVAAPPQGLPCLVQDAQRAEGVALWRLDLDHVSPEIPQHGAREVAGDDLAEVQHLRARPRVGFGRGVRPGSGSRRRRGLRRLGCGRLGPLGIYLDADEGTARRRRRLLRALV